MPRKNEIPPAKGCINSIAQLATFIIQPPCPKEGNAKNGIPSRSIVYSTRKDGKTIKLRF